MVSYAQERWFEATAGGSISIPSVEGSGWNYGNRVLPCAGISGYFSLNKTFALKTGLLYQMKGMTTQALYEPEADTNFIRQNFSSRNEYHFLSIPLQLAVSFKINEQDFLHIDAGMSYGFMLAGFSSLDAHSLKQDFSEVDQAFSYTHLVTVQPKNNVPGLPAQEGTPLYLFTPALRADAVYIWQERLVFSVFYEYNLQDVRIRTINKSNINLHSIGIGVGVRFW